MTGQPLFRSAHQALMFAFTFSATQHGTAAAAERQLAEFARDRYERMPGSGRGLRGLDGAAQAGMIRRRVEEMPPLHAAALIARFAILSPATRQAACSVLALRARHGLAAPQDIRALTLLVRRHFGLRVNLPRLADECGVTERTVQRWALEVRRWARRVEEFAMARIEVQLEEAGIVARAG